MAPSPGSRRFDKTDISLPAIRILPSLALGATVFVAGMITRRLGGTRWAIVIASPAVVAMPAYLVMGSFYSMNALEIELVAIILYLAIRMLDEGDPRYDFSMEQVIHIIDRHCTFPVVEKVKLFRLTLFNYLVGNEDMHLKDHSLVRRNDKIELSPAYDLVNTTIALRGAQEEIALPIGGRKRNLSRSILVGYIGKERLGLPDRVVDDVLARLESAVEEWERVIKVSFLSDTAKRDYENLLLKRSKVLFSSA